MAKGGKRLQGMRNNPKGNWTIQDVEAVCADQGLICTPPGGGSHYKVSYPGQAEVLTIPAHRPIKPISIRKLMALIDRVKDDG